MARTSRAERHRRRESALALVSQGKGFSDVVTAQMSQWGCSRSSAQRDCRWAHDQLQLGIDSHDAQHLMVHMATSLQRISLKAEEDKQYAAAVAAVNPSPTFSAAKEIVLNPTRINSSAPLQEEMTQWQKHCGDHVVRPPEDCFFPIL